MAPEWGNPTIDMDAYLSRIGLASCGGATLDTLRELHRAHVLSMTFENIDVTLGVPVALDVDALQDKLVRRHRGGVCTEHNLLFAAVLEQLGFAVSRVLTRVRDDGFALLPRGHSALLVDVAGRRYLCDVGYGSDGILEPLALSVGNIRQGKWTFVLDRRAGDWLLRAADGSVLYSVQDTRYRRPDFEVACYFLLTHPRSPFATSLVVQRVTENARYALRGYELVVTHADGRRVEERVSPQGLRDVLTAIFDIDVSALDLDAVIAFNDAHTGMLIPM